LNNPFPTADNFLSQLHDLHISTSNCEGKPILPDRLLQIICKPIVVLYRLEFLTCVASTPRYSQKIKDPRRTLTAFLTVNHQAVNAFRDALPAAAFRPEQQALLTETKSDLGSAYCSFAEIVKSNLAQLRSVGLIDDDTLFPRYYHDFAEPMPRYDEPEPQFFRDEPADHDRRGWRIVPGVWRNVRRRFREHELQSWKNRKREFEEIEIPRWEEEKRRYEKAKKRFEAVRNYEQLIFAGTPYCREWPHFLDPITLKLPSVLTVTGQSA
jgi:hypothetical protein